MVPKKQNGNGSSSDEDEFGRTKQRSVPQRPEEDLDRPEDDSEKPLLEVDPSNFTPEELEKFLESNPHASLGTARPGKKGTNMNPLKRKAAEEAAQDALKKLGGNVPTDKEAEVTSKDAAESETKSKTTIGPTAKKPKPAKESSAAGVKNKKLLSFDED
jgi:hypothetical protein